MDNVEINGVNFPVETEEEADFLREEFQNKDFVDTLIGLGDWLRACLPVPIDDTMGEGDNGE